MSFWSISFHLLCSNTDCIPKIWLRCCIWRSSISQQLSLPNAPQELKWFCSSPSPAVLPAQFRLQVKLLNGVQIFLRHCSKRHYSAVAFFPCHEQIHLPSIPCPSCFGAEDSKACTYTCASKAGSAPPAAFKGSCSKALPAPGHSRGTRLPAGLAFKQAQPDSPSRK